MPESENDISRKFLEKYHGNAKKETNGIGCPDCGCFVESFERLNEHKRTCPKRLLRLKLGGVDGTVSSSQTPKDQPIEEKPK